ncbi:allophanate hydrolase [Halovibrio salipaludis]|uniref:Allophanate hydrolase n=1 Tax=Halovibrio salipaludis TaxID=2032626 RepID=A0A2A2F6Z5_9GAMM|nr:allophanate hydrolase [Halovibrio salipaludis]PAU80504.1 allophanate hydrolase [Halovibrio salipaludis]
MASTTGWTIRDWQEAYRNGQSPQALLEALLEAEDPRDPAWISLASREQLAAQIATLSPEQPLYGVPFAIKDNIDAFGFETTAACPEYGYRPECDAEAVKALKEAGAVLIGKTNLDQFATGLVGTRSPWGAVPNTFDDAVIAGGSSSGSAAVVARGTVPFSLGTDTAGSGRVPAGLNNIVGLKPTRGAISTRGVVPACRSLDCVSVFALTTADAGVIQSCLEAGESTDPFGRSRLEYGSNPDCALRAPGPIRRLAIPRDPEWYSDEQQRDAWEQALGQWRSLGAEVVERDFTTLYAMAALLYEGPWIAERHAAISTFMEANAAAMNPVVRDIIRQAEGFTATNAFNGLYQQHELRHALDQELAAIDALLVPTAPITPSLRAVEADPVHLNARLGRYTNFVNLADLCALALPAGFRGDGLPFGITLISGAWRDRDLQELGAQWLNHAPTPLGATGRERPPETPPEPSAGTVQVTVAGAHLSGMPLNDQLTGRGARLLKSTATAPCYRLYALAGTTPPKPGLRRDPTGGALDVEVWAMPTEHFGSFVDLIPHPLGIGTVELADGTWAKGFICEEAGLEGATDITHLGGWRAYIQSLREQQG